jgi:hypothetical protein
MGENASCPNCRQAVPNKVTSGSAMLRCPACGLRFLPATAADIAVDVPLTGVPPRINPAARPPVIRTSAPVETPSIQPEPQTAALPPIIITDNDRGHMPSPTRATVTAPFTAAAPAPTIATEPLSIAAGAARPKRDKSFSPLEIVKVVLGGAAGLGIGYLLVFWLQYRGTSEPTAANKSSQGTASSASSGVKFPEFRPPPSASTAPATPAFSPPPYSGFGTPIPSTIPPSAPPGHTIVPSPPTTAPPPEPSPSSPPAPMPQQALDGLADTLKLPSLVDTVPTVITRLHVPDGKAFDISFNSVAANIPPEAGFLAEPKPATPLSWLVCYAPNLSGSADDKRVLGEMSHAEGELKFAWRAPIEDAEIRKELLNCLMRLTCENVSKTSLLRAASNVPRVTLDLTKDVGTHLLPGVDLPKEESVRLEIAALRAFPGDAALKDDKRVLKLKEKAIIQFQQWKGAEIQLEFRRQGEGDLQVVLRPEFRENAADKFSMTLPRLAELKEAMEKSIPENEAKLVALGKEIKALNQQLKDLGPRPGGGAAFAAWQGKLNSLQSAISNRNSQMSRISRRLPELKARLAAAPAMERFLRDMHQKAALELRVYAECGDAKLVLVNAHLDPATDEQQPGT